MLWYNSECFITHAYVNLGQLAKTVLITTESFRKCLFRFMSVVIKGHVGIMQLYKFWLYGVTETSVNTRRINLALNFKDK